MKTLNKYLFCLCFVWILLPVSLWANPTKLPRSTDKSVVIDLPDSEPITSASFTGKIHFESPEGVVRVILTDTKGNRYLISELVAQYCSTKDTLITSDAIETMAFTNKIIPSNIKIAINDAAVDINDVYLSNESMTEAKREKLIELQNELKLKREQKYVNYINAYNEARKIYWVAQTNIWSKMTYDKKQKSLGFADEDNTWGVEYYGGGVIVFGATNYDLLSQTVNSSSPYAPECNWCNRHGKNWMTQVRDQMLSWEDDIDSNCCWAFAAVGTAEARANLYYNQQINLDLSEEYVIAYSHAQSRGYYAGGNPKTALNFIANNGIPDESSCPFGSNWGNTHPSPAITSQELLSFGGSNGFMYSTFCEDSLKKHIINNGPMTCSIRWTGLHAMVLAGYKVLQVGDTISTFGSNGVIYSRWVVPAGHELVGSTCWIFKNSYGAPTGQRDDGYLYAVTPYFKDIFQYNHAAYLSGAVVSQIYTDNDIVIEDADGDGFYNWGIGPKPANAPSWIPDLRDGDDSDTTVGPIDEFGFCEPNLIAVSDTTYITSNTTYSDDMYLRNQLVIRSGATLTIQSQVDMYTNAKIHIENGGKLVVDGGFINNGSFNFYQGANFEISNNGKIVPNDSFSIPSGVKFTMNKGKIGS